MSPSSYRNPTLPPPLDPEVATSEISVLGGMLVEPGAIPKVAALLDRSSFYWEEHQLIFGAILRLVARGDAVAMDTLYVDLEEADELKAVGGPEYLMRISAAVPSAATIEYHTAKVREKAGLRRIAELARELERDPGSELLRGMLHSALTGGEPTARKSPHFRLISDDEMEDLPAPDELLETILVARGLAVLYGPPGSGKSFLALAWALCIAKGIPWLGKAVRRGLVVYVAAEGSAGQGSRVRAWKAANHVTGAACVQFVTVPVSLMDPLDVSRFLSELKALGAPVAMVVVDTVARTMIGGDENTTKDMSAYIAGADRIREALDATVLLLHHTNASGDRERGNTALRGAADTMILVKAEDDRLTLTCEKQKDAPAFPKMHLRLAPVLESCAVFTADRAPQLGAGELTEKQLEVLSLLRTHFLAEGATATEWFKVSGFPERTFYDARTVLVTRGYVRPPEAPRGGRYTLTDAGMCLLTANCGETADILRRSESGLLRAGTPPLGRGSRRTDGEVEGDPLAEALEVKRAS